MTQFGTNFAVLFSGGVSVSKNYDRYYNNIKGMYQVLTGELNVRPENIYVIIADGTDSAADRPGNINSDLSFAAGAHVLSATKAHLLDTLGTLAGQVDDTDHFFFYSFDHGSGSVNASMTTGEEELCGWGENIRDDELAPALLNIHAKHSTYVFTQCFAGGMLDNLMALPAGSFGAAATNHYEYSWGDGFAAAYLAALRNGWRYTQSVFNQAKANDPYAITTTYTDNGGTWTDNKEHPWMTGDNFPIFLGYFSQTTIPLIGRYFRLPLYLFARGVNSGPATGGADAPSTVPLNLPVDQLFETEADKPAAPNGNVAANTVVPPTFSPPADLLAALSVVAGKSGNRTRALDELFSIV
ncbi:MAG: C13 family peptidase [Gemmataceae bacterium]